MKNYEENAVVSLLADKELPVLHARYIGECTEQEMGEQYKMIEQKIGADRFVLPVIGVQGSGKSTFLNGICFNQPMLPIDAAETTCLPVEITYSEQPSKSAKVIYKDGRTSEVPAVEDELAKFVHSQENIENRLEVDRIIIESNANILKTGIVFVDLPGLGSLTAANKDTTIEYVEEAVGAIFFLRTVPPITRSEANDIKMIWPRVVSAFFVQNRWTDESDVEAEKGREGNRRIIEEIREQGRLGDKNTDVHVVNSYKAHTSSLEDNQAAFDASGAACFLKELSETGVNWRQNILQSIRDRLANELNDIKSKLDIQRSDLNLSREEIEKQIKEERKLFEEYIQDAEKRCENAEEKIDVFTQEHRAKLNSWKNSARRKLRNEMRTRLRKGITDGPMLTNVMMDLQQDPHDEAWNELDEDIMKLSDEMREDFGDFQTWQMQKTDGRQTLHIEKATRWESLLKPTFSIGGTAIGFLAAAAVAGKYAAVAGSTLGPIGTVGGAILGSVIGAWIGSKSKKVVVNSRAENREPAINAAIDEFIENTRKAIKAEVERFCAGIKEDLDDWLNQERDRHEKEQKHRLSNYESGREEKSSRLEDLKADKLKLVEWQNRLSC